jgi:hypothetical protein
MAWITYLNRDGRDSRPLGGPYASLDEAKADLDRVRKATEAADPWAHFDSFRSADVPTLNHPPVFGNKEAA